MNKNKAIGVIEVLAATIFWGIIGIFTRNLYKLGFAAIEISVIRAIVTSVFLFFIILFKDRRLLKISLRDVPVYLGTGIASYLFFNYCYMTSIGINSLSVAALLEYTSPVWVTLAAAVFFKERLTARKLVALVAALGGCALVSLQGEVSMTTRGLIYGLFSGIGYAFYSIFGAVAVKRRNPITVTFYTFLTAAIAGIPLLFVMPGCDTIVHMSTLKGAAIAIGMGICCTLIPYILYTDGLGRMSSGEASIISIMEPVIASIVGLLVFDEGITFLSGLGMLIVIGSLILLETGKGKDK